MEKSSLNMAEELESGRVFRSGFVNIIGNPNVGKSTLMNTLVGEKLSIVTPKAQTTRHRIMGIVNGEDTRLFFPILRVFSNRHTSCSRQ